MHVFLLMSVHIYHWVSQYACGHANVYACRSLSILICICKHKFFGLQKIRVL